MRNVTSRHKISAFTSREREREKKKGFSSFREFSNEQTRFIIGKNLDFVACFVLDFFLFVFFSREIDSILHHRNGYQKMCSFNKVK